MSKNNSSGEQKSPASATGTSNGIKLPPISFLSTYPPSNTDSRNKLPAATSLGISGFLNHSNLNSSQDQDHSNLGIYSQSHNQSQPQKSLPSQSEVGANTFNASNAPPTLRMEDQSHKRMKLENEQDHNESVLKQAHVHSHPTTHIHVHTHKAQPGKPHIHTHSQHALPHHHHHHHHHHPNEKATQDIPSPVASLPHRHSGNHIHLVQQEDQSKGTTALQATSTNSNHKKVQKIRPKLNTEAIHEILKEYFPKRKFLGTIIYNPTTTWETLQTEQLSGLKDEDHERFEEVKRAYIARIQDPHELSQRHYIPSIPLLRNDYINNILEVKIPIRHLKQFEACIHDGIVINNRELWGGVSGVYTDDSDILCVLAHLGLFSGNLDLKDWNASWNSKSQHISSKTTNENNESNNSGNIHGDLSVELLLLPRLPQYHGFFANGINSRSWIKTTGKHSGLSIAVYSVKWESPCTYLGEKSVYKNFQRELEQDAKEVNLLSKGQSGWSFNYNYYKKLKEKYESPESSKKV